MYHHVMGLCGDAWVKGLRLRTHTCRRACYRFRLHRPFTHVCVSRLGVCNPPRGGGGTNRSSAHACMCVCYAGANDAGADGGAGVGVGVGGCCCLTWWAGQPFVQVAGGNRVAVCRI